MIANSEFEMFAGLDLNPIKTKLMHQSGERWTVLRTEAVETEYRRFLYLAKMFPQYHQAPTEDVDTFWHYHILDTMKYAADCDRLFGYFLHHFPYAGMRGGDDMKTLQRVATRTATLYERTFGVPYPGAAVESTHETAWRIAEQAGLRLEIRTTTQEDTAVARDHSAAAQKVAAGTVQAAYCFTPAPVSHDNKAAYCFTPAPVSNECKSTYCFVPSLGSREVQDAHGLTSVPRLSASAVPTTRTCSLRTGTWHDAIRLSSSPAFCSERPRFVS
jgi:hypothetical protein